jgi:hypothetical protein
LRRLITLIGFGDKAFKSKRYAVFDQTFFEKVCEQAFFEKVCGQAFFEKGCDHAVSRGFSIKPFLKRFAFVSKCFLKKFTNKK